MKLLICTMSIAVGLSGCAKKPLLSTQAMLKPMPLNMGINKPIPPEAINLAAPAKDNWWSSLQSPILDQWVAQGLANNLDLAAGQATLRQAQENYQAESGALYPSLNLNLSKQRLRASPAENGPATPAGPKNIFNLLNTSLNVSYTFDLWGATRYQIEGLARAVDYEKFVLQGTQIALVANIVNAVLQEASFKEQIALNQKLILTQTKKLDIIQKQFSQGAVSDNEVLAQKASLEEVRLTLPTLNNARLSNQNALAVLLGKFPQNESLPTVTLAELKFPRVVPKDLASALLMQRPDVKGSYALLQQACTNVGVANANLLPQLSLNANYGSVANRTADLMKSAFNSWSIVGGLVQPLFRGGALSAKRRAALAAYEAAGAEYQQVILTAFQEVVDVLTALKHDEENNRILAKKAEFLRHSWQLQMKKYHLGSLSYLALLQAELDYYQAEINALLATTARSSHIIALYQGVGGDWK